MTNQTKPAGLKVVGFDPSLRNWGIAKGVITPVGAGWLLEINSLSVTQPHLPEGKQVRQNSSDLAAAEQLCKAAWEAAQGAQAIFVEVPHGSQSSRAMASYGVCVGVLGALRTAGIPFFEVTATEVKLASVGSKTATKEQMIAWATTLYPNAGWPYYQEKGVQLLSAAKAEHMADACAVIHAGLATNQFQQLLPLLRKVA
jgi:Holliday junction resolvasome RuvABC endonuclease subunit